VARSGWHRIVGFADHKSALTANAAGEPEGSTLQRVQGESRRLAKGLKIVLDGSFKSSIESKASLIRNQLLIDPLKRVDCKPISSQRNEARKSTA
jgi:hypothetical protein